jgi:hypothetical protein
MATLNNKIVNDLIIMYIRYTKPANERFKYTKDN